MPVRFIIRKTDGTFISSQNIERKHFDEYWQLLRIIGHRVGESPRGLTIHNEGVAVNLQLDALGENDSHGIMVYTPWSLTSDFLTVEPHKKFTLDFLRRQKTSQAGWSTLPRGALSVERLLAGKPCFATPNPQQHEKKQHILFHDWSARGWDTNKTVQVTRLADALLQEGYPLYAFHAGKLVKARSGTELVSVLKQEHQPCSEDELVEAGGRQKIARDMLHIIDFHQLNALVDGSKIHGKTLETGDWWHNLEERERKALLAALKQAKPPFDAINCQTFPDDISMTRELGSALNIATVTWHFRALNLSPGDLDTLTRHETLTRRDKTFDGNDFAGIESLTVHHCEEALTLPDGFPGLLQKFSSLKRLGLEKAQNTACLQSIRFTLSCKTLNLAGSDIDNKTLETLIRNTPNLRHLALESCEKLDWDSMDFSLFVNLESLSLDSRASLAALTHAATRLNRLNLLALDKADFPASISLKNIEALSVSGAIEASALETLLRTVPRLSTMDLTRLDIKGLLNAPLSLPALETLFLPRSPITSQNLSALLHHTPQLKKLDLAHCRRISGAITCGALPALEDLDLAISTITSQNLSALLRHAPQLKKIDLSYCKNISGAITCGALPALEELNLRSSTITSQSLSALLHHAPQLKKIDLFYCKSISDAITCGALPALEELNLRDS
ncbi:hypothetical protein, partial [Legionella geestiana]